MSTALKHDPQPDDQETGVREAMDLYDRHVKPLEETRRGEFAGVFPDGRLVTGKTVLDVMKEVKAKYGRGAVIFHIGNRYINR